jgi:probable F420-dependent oxidoreductase
MEWGVHLPHLGRSATRETLATWLPELEGLGAESGWVSDHIAWPSDVESHYPYSADGRFPGGFDLAWLDPLPTLAFAAALTERMRLGTTVLILGYRKPVQTAKMLATIDVLSEGRLVLGVGVGWMREEFEALDMPWDHRGARADEYLELFEAFFTQDHPSYSGRYYQVPEVGFSPKPVQEKVPVWVGGNSEAAWRRVARFGDAFHAAFEPVEALATAWSRVRELTAEGGRDPDALRFSVRFHLDPASRMDPAVSIAGSVEQMKDTVGRLAGIGVDHIVVDPSAPGGPNARLDAVRQFAEEVL